ncbi:hypothetical protein HDU76_001109, partial [Blyttiomyces sp. JEL0837]
MDSKTLQSLILQIPWKPIFQRLPGTWLLLLLPFAFLGPIHLPYLFAFYYTLLHTLFLLNNCRSAYGMYVAYHSAKLYSVTDWVGKYLEEVGHGHEDGGDEGRVVHDLPFDRVVHVIVLPNYKEEVDTLCETLDCLASHSRALTQYKICLAMEESEANSEEKAQRLMTQYMDSFFDITYTIHPKGRANEIRGKSSNVAWAAAEMARRGGYVSSSVDDKITGKSGSGMERRHDHEILTVMDADSAFAEDYFNSVAYHYVTALPEQRRIMMFAPSTVFDRNSNNVPVFVRVTDMFWSIGVISNLYAASPVKIPCSAYSVSMDLAIAVNFWDAGPEAIGEDLHMYLKCFFHTEGRVIVKSIFSPASQCNVEGNGSAGVRGFMSGLKARYTQAKRHLWGSLDTGYSLRRALLGLLAPGFEPVIQLKNANVNKLGKPDPNESSNHGGSFDLMTLFVLFHRLLEAHVLMGHMFLLIITSSIILPVRSAFSYTLSTTIYQYLSSEAVHPFVELALNASFWIRLACIFPNVGMIYFYERYHSFVGFERWALQDAAVFPQHRKQGVMIANEHGVNISVSHRDLKVQHLGRRPMLASARRYPKNLWDWLTVPVAGFMFYVMPQFHAQLAQLTTDSLEYLVASKPVLNRGGAGASVGGAAGVVPVGVPIIKEATAIVVT